MKKFLLGAALFVGAILGSAIGFGGGVPFLPSTSQYSEPSQIVGTMNAFINQLNGNALGAGGYAAQANGVVSFRQFCSATTTTTTDVCAGQPRLAAYTAQATIAAGAVVPDPIPHPPATAKSRFPATINAHTAAHT